MEIAKRDGDVLPKQRKIIVYLVPAINVQKGNPHNIRTLKDLTKPGLKVAIANPEGVCVGVYAVEIIEKELTDEEKEAFMRNLINYTGELREDRYRHLPQAGRRRDRMECVRALGPGPYRNRTLRSGPEPARGLHSHRDFQVYEKPRRPRDFIDFLLSPEGRAIFVKYHYFATPEEALPDWEDKTGGRQYVIPSRMVEEIGPSRHGFSPVHDLRRL